MNENITRKLIKESMLKTSNDFTDRVMQELEETHVGARLPSWLFYFVIFGIVVIGGIIYFSPAMIVEVLSSMDIPTDFPPMLFEIVIILFSMLVINKLLLLKEELLRKAL